MVNKIIVSLLTCLGLFLGACGNMPSDTHTSKESTTGREAIAMSASNAFLPDSTVNNIMVLGNEETFQLFYSKDKKVKLVEFIRESPVFIFCNKPQSEYLLAYQYEGSVNGAISCFEIGYIDDVQCGVITDYEGFYTESGVKLGMTLNELKNVKGEPDMEESNKVVYKLEDYASSSFLRKYNMPMYFFECELKDRRVVKIKYGFAYP